MAQITAEYLRQNIAEMESIVIAHNGAIEYAKSLLARLEDGTPVQEFAESIAGAGATAEVVPAHNNGGDDA